MLEGVGELGFQAAERDFAQGAEVCSRRNTPNCFEKDCKEE